MSKIGGAVQRIDDPPVLGPCAFMIGLFFGEDRMVRINAPDGFDDFIFAFFIDRGDEIDGAFVVDGFWLLPTGPDDFARGVGGLPGGPEKSYDLMTHR